LAAVALIGLWFLFISLHDSREIVSQRSSETLPANPAAPVAIDARRHKGTVEPPRDGITSSGEKSTTGSPTNPAATTPLQSAIALPGLTFEGVVLDARDRTPVESSVAVASLGISEGRRQITTGSDGKFKITVPLATRYGVFAFARGYADYSIPALATTGSYYHLEILLQPRIILRGRVIDEQMRAISGSQIALKSENDPKPVARSVTDKEGKFILLRGLATGLYILEASHVTFESGRATLELPTMEELVLVLKRPPNQGSVYGTASERNRRRVEGARILLSSQVSDASNQSIADKQGEYRFAEVREGKYYISCAADGFPEAAKNVREVDVLAGRQLRVDFVLDRGSSTLQGFVRGQESDPVPGATIQLWGQSLIDPQLEQTGDEGEFIFKNLIDDEYELGVSAIDFVPRRLHRIRPSPEPLEIVLEHGLTLHGTIRDTEGRILEKFVLRLADRVDAGNQRAWPLTTPDGQFEVGGIAEGSYILGIQLPDKQLFSAPFDMTTSVDILALLDRHNGRLLLQQKSAP
jgi:hypothetical protein